MRDCGAAKGWLFSWVTADEAYGQVKYLRVWLEQHDAPYVLATKRNDTLIPAGSEFGFAEQRGDVLIAALNPRAWRRLSSHQSAPGRTDPATTTGPGCRSASAGHPGAGTISDPDEIAYYVCYGPRRSTVLDLAWTAGSRWRVEECFAQAKNEASLDHYQVRSFRAWYAHITLSMLAPAWLVTTRAQAAKGEPGPATST